MAGRTELFEQFIEFAPDAIVGVGAEGEILLVNAQTERLFGYRREELLGKPLELLVPERYRKVHGRHRAGYFGDPRTRPMGAGLELCGRRRDGTEFPAEISLSGVRTEGRMLAIAAVRDLTERREADRKRLELEEQLGRARRQEGERQRRALEEEVNQLRRLESVGQLAGGIAHDFNNLLGVILNYAEFVAEELPEGSRAREDVEEIRRAAERGAALTRQLLIFSRRELVRREMLDINAVVCNLDRLLRRALGEHIELRTTFVEAPWPVEADAGQVEQVLVNLAVNARDAMPSGGELLIETANVTIEEEMAAGLDPDVRPGRYVRVTVSDTGLGMPGDVAERAFEPFFTTKPPGEGTGLGLATVYGIVTELGGNVLINSEPGLGTTVRVHFPAAMERDPSTAEMALPSHPPARGETVLVVEDEAAIRTVAVRILAKFGYEVLSAETGARALEVLEERAESVDLLLTDVVMPGMLGPELVERATERWPHLKVLFMSGYIHQALKGLDPARARDLDFVEKPFTAEALLTGVRSALEPD